MSGSVLLLASVGFVSIFIFAVAATTKLFELNRKVKATPATLANIANIANFGQPQGEFLAVSWFREFTLYVCGALTI